MRHGRNISPFKPSCKEFISQKEKRIAGNIFGEMLNTHPQNFTIFITTTSCHQNLSSRFGVSNVQIK
jgi:hypothetical protein